MKRIFLLIAGILSLTANAQYCPALGPDQLLPCGVNSTTLTADLSQCGPGGANPNQTTNYGVANIPYVAQTNSGTQITQFFAGGFVNNDDGVSNAIPLPFNFCFFGQTYNQFWVGSNGWISFSPPPPFPVNWANYTSASIPTAAPNVPKNCIMGPWQDWYPGIGGQVRYQVSGVAPCRKLTVSWIGVPMFSCTQTTGTFHIVIYESTNVIENHIQSKQFCNWANGTAVQGIHNLTGTIGIAVPGRNSTQWTTQNNSHRWTPSGPPVPAVLTWYQVGNPVAIGTGPTITVTPPPAGANYTCHFVYPACNAGWATCNVGLGNLGPDTVFVAPGPPTLPPPTVVANDPHCNNGCDGAIVITPNGGTGVITISWSVPGTNFSQINLCAGAYPYNLIDATGCTYNSVVTLNNPPPLTPPLVVGTDPICFGDCNGQAIASPTSGVGPYTYAWSNGQSTATATLLCSGTYSVTVLDVWNCPATGSVILTNPPITTISAITGSDTVCFGSTLDLYTVVPQPGYAYVWSTVGAPVSGQGTSTYGVDWSAESPGYVPGAVQAIAYNTAGCSSMPTVFDLTIFNVVPVITPMGPYCAVDNCETLSALPSGGAFSINGSPVTQFCPQSNGSLDTVIYTYTQSGCTFDDSLNFTVNPRPSITSILPDNTFAELCDGDTLGLTYAINSTLPGAVTWEINGNSINGGNTLSTTWQSFGTFLISAVLTTAEGCASQSATAILTIQECPNTLIYIPNTFTPDGDERNQTWAPVFTSGFNPTQFLLSVFNRWGNIIWESRSPAGEWDGTYNNSPCQSGVYTYKVWYGDPKTDAKYLLTGMVTLIR